jgi:hypothetical protein
MGMRAGMLAAVMAVVLTAIGLTGGCSQRHILRMSSPEQASMVTLFDQGQSSSEDDDTVVVLDEQERITKVAKFFEDRADRWKPFDGKPPKARYQISFRKGTTVSDTFWLEGGSLGLKTPDGKYFICDVSSAERAELLNIFHFTTNFKSFD